MVRISASNKIKVFLDAVESLRDIADPVEAIYEYTQAVQEVYGGSGFIYLCTRGLPPGEYRITRFRHPDGTEEVPRQQAHRYHELPVHTGGFLGKALAVGDSYISHPVDLTDDPILGKVLPGIHTAMVGKVPFTPFPADLAILFDRDHPDHYTETVLHEFVMRIIALVALVNQLYAAVELKAAHDFIEGQVREIARIQRSLLPHELPKIPGLEMAILYETFDMAGGDMYDIIRLHPAHGQEGQEDRWAIFVADASGHGPAAAVVMAMVHAILHASRRDLAGPADALRHLNRQLCAMRINASFVTAFLIFYEPANSRIIYSRAGHNPPAHRSVTGKVTLLDAVGEIPLGIDPEIQYGESAIDLHSGETLLIYTDGIIEAVAADGAMFGLETLVSVMSKAAPGASEIIGEVKAAVVDFQGKTKPSDDQTIVAIHVL
jgi:sigma-B regulation protein RsbU (phosphoserine phosphatase)